MSERERIVETLREHAQDLRKVGVQALFLYGSISRDDASPDSDVDLFLDYNDPGFSLVELIGLQQRLASLLGRAVDLTTRDSLHPRLRSRIERQAVCVF